MVEVPPPNGKCLLIHCISILWLQELLKVKYSGSANDADRDEVEEVTKALGTLPVALHHTGPDIWVCHSPALAQVAGESFNTATPQRGG